MPLFFDDLIRATDCSGLYTLTGYVNGTWQDIHTISGPLTGSIEVDASVNTIPVDTTLFIPGGTYQFRWVDGSGASSNIITLTIPGSYGSSGPGSSTFSSSGSQSGPASLSIVDAEIYRVDVQAGGLAYGELAVIEVYCTANGVTTTSVTQGYVDNGVFTFTGGNFVPGASIYAALIGSGWTVLSQTVVIPGAGSYQDSSSSGLSSGSVSSLMFSGLYADGSGYCEVVGDATYAETGAVYLDDLTAGTSVLLYTGVPVGTFIGASFDSSLPFIAGHQYQGRFVGAGGLVTWSNIIIAVTSGPAAPGSASGSGNDTPSLSIIEAEVGEIQVSVSGLPGGTSGMLGYMVDGVYHSGDSMAATGDATYTFTNADITAGSSLQAALDLGGPQQIYSQTVIIADMGSYPGSLPVSLSIIELDTTAITVEVSGLGANTARLWFTINGIEFAPSQISINSDGQYTLVQPMSIGGSTIVVVLQIEGGATISSQPTIIE